MILLDIVPFDEVAARQFDDLRRQKLASAAAIFVAAVVAVIESRDHHDLKSPKMDLAEDEPQSRVQNTSRPRIRFRACTPVIG